MPNLLRYLSHPSTCGPETPWHSKRGLCTIAPPPVPTTRHDILTPISRNAPANTPKGEANTGKSCPTARPGLFVVKVSVLFCCPNWLTNPEHLAIMACLFSQLIS